MAGITSVVYTNPTSLSHRPAVGHLGWLHSCMLMHGVAGSTAVELSMGRVSLDPLDNYPGVLWLRHVADLLLVSLKIFTY